MLVVIGIVLIALAPTQQSAKPVVLASDAWTQTRLNSPAGFACLNSLWHFAPYPTITESCKWLSVRTIVH